MPVLLPSYSMENGVCILRIENVIYKIFSVFASNMYFMQVSNLLLVLDGV